METYPYFERQRRQMRNFWLKESFFAESIKSINKEEKATYRLLKKFADELGIKIPKYKEPD